MEKSKACSKCGFSVLEKGPGSGFDHDNHMGCIRDLKRRYLDAKQELQEIPETVELTRDQAMVELFTGFKFTGHSLKSVDATKTADGGIPIANVECVCCSDSGLQFSASGSLDDMLALVHRRDGA